MLGLAGSRKIFDTCARSIAQAGIPTFTVGGYPETLARVRPAR